jgi:hypothetical protein
MRRPSGAIALIIVGAVLFALQFSRGPSEVIVFLVVGAVLLALYFQRKHYGLLVPGCILLGLGLGTLGDRAGIDLDNFGLGLGFLAIYIIDTMVRGRTHWWPLIPGVVLLLSSVSDSPALKVITRGWPLILVLVGVFLLWRSRGGGRGGGDSSGGSGGGTGPSASGGTDS